MTLQAVYKQFLAAPSSSALAQNASLHYITSTTSFHGPTDIIKHLSSQRNLIKKNKEDLITVVEGHNALAVQTALTLEFLENGGAYLPGLDDQFLSDRVIDIAVLHIVKFDNDGKITTIQQNWDQGALLKQLDVIGKTGRNWPIRDSVDQIKLITKSGGKPADAGPAPAPSQNAQRSRQNSTNALRDPHATLHQTGLSARDTEPDRVVSPFSGNRPRQRTFEEILGDEPDDAPDASPSKSVAPKIGAGKNFPASRLFDKPENAPVEPESPDDGKAQARVMKPHPGKYNHFSFADGSDPADAPTAGVAFDDIKSKHRSQWDFQDFVTPQKPKPGKSVRQPRHWGTDQNDYDESPAKPAPGMAGGKARRDADTQIELQDDGEDNERNQRVGAHHRGAMHNSGHGLYKNRNAADEGAEPAPEDDSRALGNITNLKNRHNDFDPHFDMNDNSPTTEGPKARAPVPEDRKKAVNMMQSNWSAYDQSPAQKENSKPSADRENGSASQGIKTHGDGMGNPKSREWTTTTKHGGIKLGGDGMGNSKGGRGWSIGDDSDEEQQQAAPVPGRQQGAKKAPNNFWEF